jgi:hypothetical protein
VKADPGTNALLALGDEQYDMGALSDFRAYYDAKMGNGPGLFTKTLPVPGNHEYKTSGALGYYTFWGARAGDPSKGYYATDVGPWRLIAANSNCSAVGGCGATSPQGQFISAALASAPRCALVFDHHPAFSDGKYAPGTSDGRTLFNLAYAGGADLFLSGHDHNYQRFAPRTSSGTVAASTGLRQFVVGTGGESTYGLTGSAREFGTSSYIGALRLMLSSTGYGWQFKSTSGTVVDSGSGTCH